MMYGYGSSAWGVGGWIIMAILMVVFWATVVTAIALIFRRRVQPRMTPDSRARSHGSALQILSERFARGEIDEAEYRARRATLHDVE
ncbi:MAG: SHOCT domain-containing protein [Actinomycetota bacterium]